MSGKKPKGHGVKPGADLVQVRGFCCRLEIAFIGVACIRSHPAEEHNSGLSRLTSVSRSRVAVKYNRGLEPSFIFSFVVSVRRSHAVPALEHDMLALPDISPSTSCSFFTPCSVNQADSERNICFLCHPADYIFIGKIFLL